MSWFAELVIAEAFAALAGGGRAGAIVAADPLAAPFCHVAANPPLRFALARRGAPAMIRRFGGAVWIDRPLEPAERGPDGRPALAGRLVLADLRGIPADAQAGELAHLAALAGAPPALVRLGAGSAALSGHVPLWEAPDRTDTLWLAPGQRGGGAGERLLRFVRRHFAGESDALDTAVAFAARRGLVTGLRFRADGGVSLGLDPLWCLAGFDELRAARTMREGRVAVGGGEPATLALPPVPGPMRGLGFALGGSEEAVRACRVRLDGLAVPALPRFRRGEGIFRVPADAAPPRRLVLEARDVAVTGLWLELPPPMAGLYGAEFPDPLDRYDPPGGSAP